MLHFYLNGFLLRNALKWDYPLFLLLFFSCH
jgi:hypothetical protein